MCQNEENSEKINPKEKLQEYTQEIKHTLPEYVLVAKEGSEHNSVFEVAVYFGGNKLATGRGASKKSAQQEAAKNALEYLKKEGLWES